MIRVPMLDRLWLAWRVLRGQIVSARTMWDDNGFGTTEVIFTALPKSSFDGRAQSRFQRHHHPIKHAIFKKGYSG